MCPSVASYHPYISSASQMLPPGATIVSISGLTNVPPPPSSIVAMVPAALSCNYTMPPPPPTTIVTTTSVTTQTPKTQKRVTIMEPTTHTFDPMLPTMVAVMQGTNSTAASSGPATAQSAAVTSGTTKGGGGGQGQASTTPIPIININSSSQAANSEDNKIISSSSSSSGKKVEPENKEDTSGMLDRISHDLNYLLNGAEDDDQIPPPPRPSAGSKPSATDKTPTAEVIFSKKDEL